MDAACRECGCTWNDACHDEQRGACKWVEPDLCSHCQDSLELFAALVAGDGSDEVREDVVIELRLHHAEQIQKILDHHSVAAMEATRG
jgi:hypothetical protein